MFASQLLRILQTLPNDVKYETRLVFDPDEQDSSMRGSMRGSQNSRFYESESFGKEAKLVSFGNREIYQQRAFKENRGNERWSAESVNGFTKDPEGGTKDFPRKEDQNGLLYHLTSENRDSDSLSSETKDENKSWRSGEFECLTMVEEPKHSKEDDIHDSGHILLSASSFIDPDPDFDTEKIKGDFDLPELQVCYREINYQIVKDVCADEVMPVEENIWIENGNYGHCEDPEGCVAEEPVISDGSSDLFLEDMERVGVDESWSKEETKDELLEEGKPRPLAVSSLEKDTAKDHDSVASIQTDKNVKNDLVEETFIVRSLPIQEFGARSFLRSFLNSLEIEENSIVQPCNDSKDISLGESWSESFAVSSAEREKKEEVQARIMLYKSRVQHQSISFNFNSPVSVIPGIMTESQDLHKHENISETDKYSTGNISDQSLDAYSSNSSSTSPIHFTVNEDISNEKGHETSPDKNDTNLSTDDQVQTFSSNGPNPPNINGQEIEPHFPKHERGNSDNASVISQTQYDGAESSHSAASFIMFSGPIAYSGSLSLRSDGSATSTRSFAFPILLSEENRSPMRMEDTDLRHFQKHRDWRSGLLCCRF